MNVCLIGYNLTNFIIALELIKKGFAVDILFEKISKKTKTNRTIGISKNNFEFLSSNFKQIYKYSWPITKIKIFNQRNNSNEFLEFSNENKKNFFLIKYIDLFNLSERTCKKSKKICFKLVTNKEIENLEIKNKYDFVINSDNKEWGIGQVQSIINEKITVNFENVGKKVINSNNIKLEKFNK